MAKLHYALLLVSLVSHSNADIKTLTLTSDPRQIILLHKFAFTHHGQVSISASEVYVTSSSLYALDHSRLGFFLLPKEALHQVLLEEEQNANYCILNSFYTIPLFTFRDLSPPPHRFLNGTYPVNYPSEYSLFFAKCDPVAHVSMNMHTELFNLDSNGSKDYLLNGQSRLILLFIVFSFAFFFLSVLWAYSCYCNMESTNWVHLLITGLINVKTLSLICAGLDMYFVKLTGTHHVISSLIIMASIIIGFFFFKPFLQEKEAKVLIVAIMLQVLPNLAFPFVVTMGDARSGVMVLLASMSMVCTYTFLVTVGRSIWLLRKAAKTDEKAGMRLANIKEFALYYVLAIGYLYVSAMVAYDLRIVMAYEYHWVSNAVEEGVNLRIFLVMLSLFRPVIEFILDAEDEKEETMALANEEESEA
ncbi:hypothetical protein BT93_K0993 [Corymbia citriodora subsp. variegata]|nr:hypothetical protein BT93_K0993 [Corymbia citriodora subsp. variegata]